MSDRGDDELQRGWPDDVLVGEEGAVRVFWLKASEMQGLVDRLALVLSEHMHPGDELHVTYNSMQNGWEAYPGRKGSVLRAPEAPWTELRFEYSAFVILRGGRQ
jgi:hypothetical protein